ncbi:MAG: vitamin K epoxide reductase family protein, partial [Gaiellaceae bacterium]
MSRDLALRIGIGVLSLAGIAIASYLTAVHYGGASLYCPVTGGCETVQNSPESKLLGVPVATLGLASYLLVFGSVFVRDQRALLLAATLTLVGIAFSAWLLYAMLVRIDAVCAWCLGNDIVALLLVPLTLTRLL